MSGRKKAANKTKPKTKAQRKKLDDEEFQLSDEEELVQRVLQRVADHVPDPEKPTTEATPNKKRKTQPTNSNSEPITNGNPSPATVMHMAWHPAETTVLEFLITGCLPVTHYRLDSKAPAGQHKGVNCESLTIRSALISFISHSSSLVLAEAFNNAVVGANMTHTRIKSKLESLEMHQRLSSATAMPYKEPELEMAKSKSFPVYDNCVSFFLG